MVKPKFLRKITDGYIYPYTDVLAARADMVPYDPDDPDGWKNSPKLEDRDTVKIMEKELVSLKLQLQAKDVEIHNLRNTINRLTNRPAEKPKAVPNDLRADKDATFDPNNIVNPAEAPGDPKARVDMSEDPPATNLTPAQQQAAINKAVADIMAGKNPNEITGGGHARVAAIEARVKFPVSAEQREIAEKALN